MPNTTSPSIPVRAFTRDFRYVSTLGFNVRNRFFSATYSAVWGGNQRLTNEMGRKGPAKSTGNPINAGVQRTAKTACQTNG